MSTTILAVDLGTSSLKAAVVDDESRIRAFARRSYPTAVAAGGRAEQEPRDWLDALCGAVRDLADRQMLAGISGVVVCGHMSAALLVDGGLDPVRPCIIWSDQRADAEAGAAVRAAGAADLYARTGNPPTATYTAPKLAWLARHEPEALTAARAFLQPKDWLAAQLTGRLATDLSDASCTGLLDLAAGRWDEGLLDLYGVPARLVPEILPSTALSGTLLAPMAALLGLPPGLPVLVGGGDGPATAAGAGALAEGEGYAALGTSAWISFVSRHPLADRDGRRLATFAHVLPGLYVETGSMQAAGAAIEWAAELIGVSGAELVGMALAAPPPSGAAPLFLPYLQGERTPHWSALPAGALLGLGREHGRAEIAGAVLEGVMLHLRAIADVFADLGRRADPLPVAGGGFERSPGFPQRLADAFGGAVAPLPDSAHGTVRGAALIGLLGLGVLASPADALAWRRRGEVVRPLADAEAISRRYRIFKEAWDGAFKVAGTLGAPVP